MKKFKIREKLFKNSIANHISFWVYLFFVITLIGIGLNKELYSTVGLSLSMTLFMIKPVYEHFFILNRYFNNAKYYRYLFWLTVLIFANGFLGYYIFVELFGLNSNGYQVSFDIFFLLVISTSIKFTAQGYKNQVQFHRLETKQVEAELNSLKGQLNPHFLFNTLNNIYSLSLDENKNLPIVILKLSDLMRYILDSSKKSKVNLVDEIKFINNYIDMERIRLRENSIIEFNYEGDFSKIKIAPMLFLPFLENIFKHGVNPKDGKLESAIELNSSDNRINFRTYNKIHTEIEANNFLLTKNGLGNIKQRLELLYPNKHKLEILNNGLEYRIDLMLEI
jgi:two-component system, LytTR family, sensor kinase